MNLPLARQYFFDQVASTLGEMNVDLSSLLARNKIPEWQYSEPEDAVPLIDFVRMFEIGARAVGDDRFGLAVAERNKLDRFASFGDLVSNATTVYDALKIVSQLASQEVTTIKIWLQQRYNGILFCRKQFVSHPDIQFSLVHLERYVMTELVRFVRLGAGRNWCPPEVYFSASKEVMLPDWDSFKNSKVHFESPCSAFLVPNDVLWKPIQKQSSDLDSSEHKHRFRRSHEWKELDFVKTLRYLLSSLQSQKCANTRVASEVMGISARTMRRRLARHGTSFRKVLGQARYQKALELLIDPAIDIADIGDSVGYEYPQHFIRAFKRWTGITPGQFREGLLRGESKLDDIISGSPLVH